MTEIQPFIVERFYKAPARNVWRAITEIAFIREWYFNIPAFRPEPGFEFSFESKDCNEAKIHHCKVIEVVKGKKLSYSWKYEGYAGNSVVTFEIFEEGKNQTRLRLTHAGLETFPPDLLERKNIKEGWNWLIDTSLRNLLEQTPGKFIEHN